MPFSVATPRFLFVAVLLAAAAIPIAAPVASANSGPSGAEAHALDLINQERAQRGRAALQWDARLADVAQERSNVQANKNEMFHDLAYVTRRMDQKNIRWFESVGEALLMGTPRSRMESAEEAVAWWEGSDAHWDMLMSIQARYNYIALGVARANNGWYFWTAVMFVGPDRTAPKATMSNASTRNVAGGNATVNVSWTGHDVQLFAFTSGLRDFRLQRRVGSGNWTTVTDWTTATSKSFDLQDGRKYSFRVRARDEKGNKSGWSAPISVTT
jgi:uncharacterized protein YkwD